MLAKENKRNLIAGIGIMGIKEALIFLIRPRFL